jgi:hypothetical protein
MTTEVGAQIREQRSRDFHSTSAKKNEHFLLQKVQVIKSKTVFLTLILMVNIRHLFHDLGS